MIHVYLDDVRPCPRGFVAARTAEECILLLEQCEVDILSLDFDLGWHAPSGSAVASWIAQNGRFPRRLYFHTSSPAGREQMVRLLLPALPPDVELHNGPMPDDVLQQAAAGG
ncbi:cell division protein FtsJ [Gordoniibacillus kamchatkensis]|uniref:Cell division protein FtsJ n=1 Tax=Gordoniibacillus kamchatkensis TaxID=1590651 RepID=A0ABR5AGK6_9BACL|nr:cyclic-phosphate processing receiver domain-containing protein [Paenibacillus sp. VKM B-2647]KIL40164.1 cell division protein FtsJ [Paenibacillus sp. VKM B-2647]